MKPIAFALSQVCVLVACVASCTNDHATTPSTSSSSSLVDSGLTDSGRLTDTGVSARRTDTFATTKGELALTPINHASLLLEIDGKAIYVDPTADGSVDGLPKADWIFITDIHSDHLSDAGIGRVKKEGTILVGPAAVDAKTKMSVVLKNGESKDFTLFSAEAIPMYNLTRGPSAGQLFHDKGRGDGYVLTFGQTRIYISGDTECTPEMKALSNIDVAFVCMNLPYTMPPKEATDCVNAFKPKVVFPYHHRGSNLDEFKPSSPTEVRVRSWY